jgi:hypothetical protein
MVSAGNQKAIEDVGLSFIFGRASLPPQRRGPVAP